MNYTQSQSHGRDAPLWLVFFVQRGSVCGWITQSHSHGRYAPLWLVYFLCVMRECMYVGALHTESQTGAICPAVTCIFFVICTKVRWRYHIQCRGIHTRGVCVYGMSRLRETEYYDSALLYLHMNELTRTGISDCATVKVGAIYREYLSDLCRFSVCMHTAKLWVCELSRHCNHAGRWMCLGYTGMVWYPKTFG